MGTKHKGAAKKKAASKKKAATRNRASTKSKKEAQGGAPRPKARARGSRPKLTADDKEKLKKKIREYARKTFEAHCDKEVGYAVLENCLELTLFHAVEHDHVTEWGPAQQSYVRPHIECIACRYCRSGQWDDAAFKRLTHEYLKAAKKDAKAALSRLAKQRRLKGMGRRDLADILAVYCDGYPDD